jgi:aspartate/methionine/tyrosine aminotransferase
MTTTEPGTNAELAARALRLKRSAIREVFDLAIKLPDAIRLEVGEPSFRTPQHIIVGALAAAEAGFTHYTPNGGLESLREMLAEKIGRVNRYRADPASIVVTPGAMNALFTSFLALLNPGDQVLLPTPGFPNMDEIVSFLGGDPVFYRLAASTGYLPDVDEIKSLIGPRTKAMFVNTPANPSGVVFPRSVVQDLVEIASSRRVWMIFDEVYDELVLDESLSHVAAASIDPMAPIISVYCQRLTSEAANFSPSLAS